MEQVEKLNSCVLIELGGETRKLEYTLHSVVQYKMLTGKNLFKGEIDPQDASEIVGLLWAGLISHDESLDGYIDSQGKFDEKVTAGLRQIAKWVTFSRMNEISALISDAFGRATPVAKKKS